MRSLWGHGIQKYIKTDEQEESINTSLKLLNVFAVIKAVKTAADEKKLIPPKFTGKEAKYVLGNFENFISVVHSPNSELFKMATDTAKNFISFWSVRSVPIKNESEKRKKAEEVKVLGRKWVDSFRSLAKDGDVTLYASHN